MNIINNFGQRNFAKLLFIISICLGVLSFVIKNHNMYGQTFIQSVIDWKTWLGVILLSAPNGFLAWSAIKSREYRFVSIILSLMILGVNFILFYLNVNLVLFIATIFELLSTIVFFIVVSKSAQTRKVVRSNKNKAQKTKSTNENPT